MTIKKTIILTLGLAVVASAPAFGNQYLLTPISGSAFTADGNVPLRHAWGKVSIDSPGYYYVFGSLGLATGGTNYGFYLHGNNDWTAGGWAFCKVLATGLNDGGSYWSPENVYTGVGRFTLGFNITPPAGQDYYFSMQCQIAGSGQTYIYGVEPLQ